MSPDDARVDLAVELHRIRRAGGLVRSGDYAPGLTSVAATVGGRAAVGIVLPEQVSGDRYLPLVLEAAARIRRELV
jgi:DNA-binding IclR family transcriptional regulator